MQIIFQTSQDGTGEAGRMIGPYVYFGSGAVVVVVIWILILRSKVGRETNVNRIWEHVLNFEGLVLAVILWPLFTGALLIWWFQEHSRLNARERNAKEKAEAEARRRENKYADMKMDELLVEQNRVIAEFQNRK